MGTTVTWWKLGLVFVLGVLTIGLPGAVLIDLRFGQSVFLHWVAGALLIIPGFTLGEVLFANSRRARRVVAVAHVSIAAALWVIVGVNVYLFLLRGRQVRTYADMRTIVNYLDQYSGSHGRFPTQLSLALPSDLRSYFGADAWGHPYFYEAHTDSFVLVSFGRDGKPDVTDYWSYRQTAPTYRQDPTSANVACLYDADQIVSDRGWHQAAGK